MPMSYRMYIERRKALDEECAYTEKQCALATDRWKQAGSDKIRAEENLDHGSEELRGARESDLLEKSARLDAAYMEYSAATEDRDRARAERTSIESEFPGFERAAKDGISPADKDAPADMATWREKAGDFMDQAKGVIDAGVMTGGMIAQIATATPQVHEQAMPTPTIHEMQKEVFKETIPLSQYETQVHEARVSATPGEEPSDTGERRNSKERDAEQEKERQKQLAEGREREEKKGYLESQIEAIGEEEHIVGTADLKKRNMKMLDDMAKSSSHSSLPDPDRSAELIGAQSKAIGNDNEPQNEPPSSRAPANDNDPVRTVANDNRPQPPSIPDPDRPLPPMPAHSGSGGGIPDPDRPSPALAAAQPAPANDNSPRAPANDNDPRF